MRSTDFHHATAGIGLLLLCFACTPTGQSPAPLFLDSATDIPALFAPELVSTAMHERDLAIAPAGDHLLFTVSTPDQSLRALVEMRRNGSGWSAPQVAPFSGVFEDLEPAFTPDGKVLFFASNRPLRSSDSIPDFNLWRVARSDGGWETPEPLGDLINTDGNEYYPSVASNGNLYFTATRPEGKGLEDIYVSNLEHGTYTKPVSLDSTVNTQSYEFNAFVAPDESYLIFGSFGRPDGFGGGDLYISWRTSSGTWGMAKNLGEPINGPKLDYCPYVDVDRGVFYYSSDRGSAVASDSAFTYADFKRIQASPINGLGNIYKVNAGVLFQE